ncbi:glycerate kinase [Bifidobacterium sp. 82T24]|uniref:glycerate kinase n=1 Tax=Bifidobacterium pluvialisilvae TaxID=2834436 RepID=UPI001C590FAE|nr:glycerate kinase [Bifidobacterium pluvialisilvae]MBW3088580.1 glycerate kinase [Bifidobacterium pluvialisilvae]
MEPRPYRTPSVLLASDSFKGSASSRRIEDLLEEGVRRVVPDCSVTKYPIADGGEGTVDAVINACGGERRTAVVHGPLGDDVTAEYGLLPDGAAIIEMAQASGITLIEQTLDNAIDASTYGVGQVILDAIDAGARRIYIGLGGSATSDGGTGMAKAFGVRFLDAAGDPVPCGLRGLRAIAAIDTSGIDPRIGRTEFVALTDVSNPLVGPSGAVHIYGPQKGLTADRTAKADAWMRHYADVVEATTGVNVAELPGAGAAGGLGAGLVAFCGARIRSGIETVLDLIGLEDVMDSVDLVITGEGRMDAQSANGKAPVGVAQRAKRHGKPVVAVVGGRADDLGAVYRMGVDLVVPAIPGPASLDECIARTAVNVPIAGETAMRAFLLGRDALSSPAP